MNKVLLAKGKEKSIKNKHPWIFSGALSQKVVGSQSGEIVNVESFDGQNLGFGLWDNSSQIVCRMFHFGKEQDFDQAFWFGKFESAWCLRIQNIDTLHTNVFRFIHAEGDFLPGIICDIYDNVAVIQKMIDGLDWLQEHVIAFLKEKGKTFFYVKGNKIAGKTSHIEQGWVGEKPSNPKVMVLENGINFLIDVQNGQKTGFFVDQRDNRFLLQQYSKGKSVLNTFSFSGGFSLYAAKSGAQKVVSVDISKLANDDCLDNFKINNIDVPHEAYTVDCFQYLRDLKERYDVIVLDPPAFAKSSAKVMNAARGYKDLNLLAFKNLKPNGYLFTFSCSQHIDKVLFQKIVFGAAADSGRNVRIIRWLNQPIDHPVNIYHPEGDYLKGLLLFVE